MVADFLYPPTAERVKLLRIATVSTGNVSTQITYQKPDVKHVALALFIRITFVCLLLLFMSYINEKYDNKVCASKAIITAFAPSPGW